MAVQRVTLQKTARFSIVTPGGPASASPSKPSAKETDTNNIQNTVPQKGLPAVDKGAAPSAKTPQADHTKANGAGLDLDALAAAVTRQGAVVRQLKKDGVTGAQLQQEVDKLMEYKKLLAIADASTEKDVFDRKAFDNVILQRMFVIPAFEIHNGVAGLFDLGPPACGLKANVIDIWRKHFVLTENMLEMECTNLTPSAVLETSGHVDKFTDLMVKDVSSGECHRADKLLEDFIDELLDKSPAMPQAEKDEHRRVQRQADAYTPEQLGGLIEKYGIKSPNTGNDLTQPFPFNLMFKTTIGPEGTSVGYLRPETAQGLFVNFRRLLDYNAQRVPFAAAQIGLGFRNEISPRAGLLRVREFCMAEIEHFVNPADKSHQRFPAVANKELVLFGADDQLGSGKTKRMTIGEAVKAKLVDNETLGYFMARTQLFMERIGMDPARMRFRQHLRTEMAHYAADCWDLEIKSSYGWVECVGHADRSCYDLQVHAKRTGRDLSASQRLDQPKTVTIGKLDADKKLIGLTFKQDQRKVVLALEALGEDQEALSAFEAQLKEKGEATLEGGFLIKKEMVKWTLVQKTVIEEKFLPSVIEPSFGIGRILYSLLEHSFYIRDGDEQRTVMRFKPAVAPYKVGVFPLSTNEGFYPFCNRLCDALSTADISSKADMSGAAVGRRYARADEIGIPFGCTVDFETINDETVTLRERDSMSQIRLPISEVADLVGKLVRGSTSWEAVLEKYPVVYSGGPGEEDGPASGASAPTAVEKTVRGSFSRPNPPIQVTQS